MPIIRTKEEARAWRAGLDGVTATLDDAAALEAASLYPAWRPGQAYSVGQRVRHSDRLYRCVQAHTSQADWTPDVTPALWAITSVDEWPEWVQPTGAHDAYNIGDKVTHGGKHYTSLINGNTWSPAAYPAGWKEET